MRAAMRRVWIDSKSLIAADDDSPLNIISGTNVTVQGGSGGSVIISATQPDISGKADKSATVSSVAYDTANKKLTKTINGTTTDVVTAARIAEDGAGVLRGRGFMQAGHITAGGNVLSSYWNKIWDCTITQYLNTDITMVLGVVSAILYSQTAFIRIRIRQRGANNGGAYNFGVNLEEIAGNMTPDRFRLYYDNSTGYCALYGNPVQAWDRWNIYLLFCNVGSSYASVGTFYSTTITEVQTLPSSAYVEASATGIAGTAINARKVNNFTVGTNVPADAEFTDTTYSVQGVSSSVAGLQSVANNRKVVAENSFGAYTTVNGLTTQHGTKIITIPDGTTSQSFTMSAYTYGPAVAKVDIIIDNRSNGSDLTISVPNTGSYVSCDGVTALNIASGKIGEMNVINANSKFYIRTIS